jgi:hypothetical protein
MAMWVFMDVIDLSIESCHWTIAVTRLSSRLFAVLRARRRNSSSQEVVEIDRFDSLKLKRVRMSLCDTARTRFGKHLFGQFDLLSFRRSVVLLAERSPFGCAPKDSGQFSQQVVKSLIHG